MEREDYEQRHMDEGVTCKLFSKNGEQFGFSGTLKARNGIIKKGKRNLE